MWVHGLRLVVGLDSLTSSNRPETGHARLRWYQNRTYGGSNETFDFSSVKPLLISETAKAAVVGVGLLNDLQQTRYWAYGLDWVFKPHIRRPKRNF